VTGRAPARAYAAILVLGVAGLFLLRGLRLPAVVLPWPARSGRARQPLYARPGTDLIQAKVVGREHGQRHWEFRARRINRSVDGLIFAAEGIEEGRVYNGAEVYCTFGAARARYEALTRRLTLSGGLVGRLADGTATFTAATAVADLARDMLSIPGQVKVTGKEINLSADSLTAGLTDKTITLKGNAVVVWSGGTLRAAEVTYSIEDGSFTVGGEMGEGVDLTL